MTYNSQFNGLTILNWTKEKESASPCHQFSFCFGHEYHFKSLKYESGISLTDPMLCVREHKLQFTNKISQFYQRLQV